MRKKYKENNQDEHFVVVGFADNKEDELDLTPNDNDVNPSVYTLEAQLDEMIKINKDLQDTGRTLFYIVLLAIVAVVGLAIGFIITTKSLEKDVDYWKQQAQIEEVEIWNDLCEDSDERRIIAEACKDASYSGIILDESACRLTLIWMETKSDEQYYLYVMHHADKKYSVSVKQYADGYYYVDFIGEER